MRVPAFRLFVGAEYYVLRVKKSRLEFFRVFSAKPLDHIVVLLIIRISEHFDEMLIAAWAAAILRRTCGRESEYVSNY